MTTHDDQLGTVTEIMRETDIAVLTYVSETGDLVSVPMATQQFEHPGTTWFLTEVSDKTRAIQIDSRVNVAYSSKAGWVSLAGNARISDDRAKLRELWDAGAEAFMTGGPDDAENVLLEIDASTAEYWESPGKVSAAVQLAKGLISEARPDMGDNATVEL
jgi:general stress protein 26